MSTRNRTAAFRGLLAAIRAELVDDRVSYSIGDRSVVFWGDSLGRLIATTLAAEESMKPAERRCKDCGKPHDTGGEALACEAEHAP